MNWTRFKKTLPYDWPFYLTLPVIFGVCVSYVLNQIHQPADYEKLNIFVASKTIQSDAFCGDIQEKLSADGLKKTTAVQSNPSDSLFAQKLSVVGYSGSDLFLLPTSVLKSMNPDDILLRMSDELKSHYVIETTPDYYVVDGYSYGVRLFAQGESTWLSSYIGFLDEDYYLCLNVKSKNLGNYGLYDNPDYKLGLMAFTYLQGGHS